MLNMKKLIDETDFDNLRTLQRIGKNHNKNPNLSNLG